MAFELTKEFIEKLLGTPILDFEVSAGCEIGDNVAGSLKKIKARAKSGDNIHVVHKTFPPKDVPQYEIAKNGAFRVETSCYTHLLPTLQKLVKSKGGDYVSPLPKLFAFFNDDENDYICMEDVRPQGYKMPDKYVGLTYLETSLALKKLAEFHAFSYMLVREMGHQIFANGEMFERFNPDILRKSEQMQNFLRMFDNAAKNAVEILENRKPQLAQKFKEVVPIGKAGEIFMQQGIRNEKNNFSTIVHGDFWSNNFLIKYGQSGEEKGKPIGVKFVDFQFTRRGVILEDLVYFILTSTTTEFRQQHLIQVLSDYYDSFESALKSIKYPMPPHFTRGSLVDSFHESLIAGLVHMTFAIPLQLGAVLPPPPPPAVSGSEGGGPPVGLPVDNDGDFASQMFAMGLRMMMDLSPRALQRLEDVAEEILSQY